MFQSKYFSFFLLILPSTISIVIGHALLKTGTDYDLIGLFRAGEYYSIIVNPFSGYILSKLYLFMPLVPWYSILLLAVFYIILFLVNIFVCNNTEGLRKYSLIILLSLFFLQITYVFSITILTGLSIAVACLFAKGNFRYFLIAIVLSAVLRIDIFLLYYFVILVPLLAVALQEKSNVGFTQLKLKLLVLIFLPVAINLINSAILLSDEYEGMKQKNRLTEAIDYNLVDYSVMNEEEYFLAKNGLVWDDDLFIKVNHNKWPSVLTIYFDNLPKKLSDIQFNSRNNIFLIFMGLIFIIFAIPLQLDKRKRMTVSVVFLLISLYILFIVQSRDVLRTTVPLMLSALFAVFAVMTCSKTTTDSDRTFNFIIVPIVLSISLYISYYQYNRQSVLVKNQIDLIRNADYIISSYRNKNIIIGGLPVRGYYPSFPVLWESENLSRDFKGNVIRRGWLAGHPYFTSRIKKSMNNKLDIHQFIIDKDTYFIGRSLRNEDDIARLMEIYDQFYPVMNKRHATRIVEEKNGFIAAKIVLEPISE